jgi:hypothetical protein
MYISAPKKRKKEARFSIQDGRKKEGILMVIGKRTNHSHLSCGFPIQNVNSVETH